MIAEQSAALGDVVIISTQRDIASVPPAVRLNANARLFMLGLGFFQYQKDGQQTRSGRTEYIALEDVPALIKKPLDPNPPDFTAENIPVILNSSPISHIPPPVKMFLGLPGSGRTYSLKQSTNGKRVVYLDMSLPHRENLVSIVEQCRAIAPTKAPITQLADCAALAMRSEPTTLLIDNLDKASEKILGSTVPTLIDAASNVFMSGDDTSAAQKKKINPLIPRCTVERIKPLTAEQARALIWSNIKQSDIKDPQAVEKRIISLSGGHPGTILKLSQKVQKGDLQELRDFYAVPKRVNLMWVILLFVLIGIVLLRYKTGMDTPTMGAVLLISGLIIRRFAMRSMTTQK
jgi:hypothetical protein